MPLNVPLKLTPQVKEIVWGGDWLAKELNRPSAPGATLGESWEAYSGSVVENGPAAGTTLGELFEKEGAAVFGSAAAQSPKFPLLVKFIDAHQNLSVQVHPDNKLAQELENYPYGKTEYWYVLEAAPGAEIVYSLKREGIGREELGEALREGKTAEYCQSVPVKPGDVVFIPAGTVHALTTGVVVYELQQDSNITYRLYDWGRVGREIHVEKGLKSIDLNRYAMQLTHPEPTGDGPVKRALLAECDLFRSELVAVSGKATLTGAADSFLLLSVVEGSATLTAGESAPLPLRKGDTLFLPVGLDYAVEGTVKLIESRVN